MIKYKKLIKISLSSIVLFFISFVFSALSKRGLEYTDMVPNIPIAKADIPAPVVYVDGGSGDSGGGGGGGGGCDGAGGGGGGGGGGGDCM